ncbi:ECF transporter S component [Microbacterium lushaniae]|uniref:ECF transporter S component n=1 Tax=Microbacterium lushaniae TaxID=2614639 RepID=A0A5J6L0K0_9MICO|nr:ECF transporter S component [Microbacterium lushaniae]QEW02018.1 ECF transporter S component [Microbacterium lushaniae]
MATMPDEETTEPSVSFDVLAADLQRLRREAGDVSYAEIAARIAERRESEGMSVGAARVARSTVFDVFRPDRRRVNADLVREVVLALGEDERSAAQWRRRSLAARMAPAPRPAAPAHPGGAHLAGHAAGEGALRVALIVALLVGCTGLNLFGAAVVRRWDLPVFLDMIGTATAAFALGPWYGALVGATTNVLGGIILGPENVLFAVVNVTGAVVWGYGIRRFARTIPRFVVLNVAVALACTFVAVPVNVLYDGNGGHLSDAVIAAMRDAEGLWAAAFSANLPVSVGDKIIAGFLALACARLLGPFRLRDPQPPLLMPRGARGSAPFGG